MLYNTKISALLTQVLNA